MLESSSFLSSGRIIRTWLGTYKCVQKLERLKCRNLHFPTREPLRKLKATCRSFCKLRSREPARNIPQFMLSYYKRTGKGIIPAPKVSSTRKRGSVVQYQLVWEGEDGLTEWVPAEDILNLDEAEVPAPEARSCNTRKDRDRRKNRHTCGMFIG